MRPKAGDPKDANHQERLEGEPGPGHPRFRGKAVDFDMGQRHVEVGREDRRQKKHETPASNPLDAAFGNEETEAPEDFEDAAGDDAEAMAGNPRGHDRQKKIGAE